MLKFFLSKFSLSQGVSASSTNLLDPAIWASLTAQLVKDPPAVQEIPVWSLCREGPLERDRLPTPVFLRFPCGSAGKEATCNAGDLGSILGLGRSPGEGKGYPFQYSGLENSMDYGPWGYKRVGHDLTTRLNNNTCKGHKMNTTWAMLKITYGEMRMQSVSKLDPHDQNSRRQLINVTRHWVKEGKTQAPNTWTLLVVIRWSLLCNSAASEVFLCPQGLHFSFLLFFSHYIPTNPIELGLRTSSFPLLFTYHVLLNGFLPTRKPATLNW